MRFGCCVKDAREARVAEHAGYDFVECSVLSLHPEGEEAVFLEVLRSYQMLSIPVEACNLFLPKDLHLVGESLDHVRIKRYVAAALKRVKTIGADTIVFGSGYARNVPSGFARIKAEEQIVEFLKIAADHAERLGLTIVIEPLNRKESNIINNVAEGVYFARKVNSRSIQVLADFYHMDEEYEPLSEIVKHKDYLKHIHLADTFRQQPGTGKYPYAEFSQCLKDANYNGRICIEAIWTTFDTSALTDSLHYLKSLFRLEFDKKPV
ncbi:hypothetical protein SD71_10440 [Cohnella kolymensis]|uniref:Xylose isomerase-like TIM barrel domain-containing protein n=1 Tax=Cohnella kolymensis TaxID=1590652 RepID=A0ABR5A4R3_9BACL|nr:sugar phosphate isomerase/epimerase family protein [Cohnella kolymensis]KIL36044.1 hypothetical protein SD71_10440 [Cohnella kolymensis]